MSEFLLVVSGEPFAVDGGQDAHERSQIDVGGDTHTKDVLTELVTQVDVSNSQRVGATGNCVGLVVHEGETVHFLTVDGIEECVDGTVAAAGDLEKGSGRGALQSRYLWAWALLRMPREARTMAARGA